MAKKTGNIRTVKKAAWPSVPQGGYPAKAVASISHAGLDPFFALAERGLISKKTLVEKMGLDYKQEEKLLKAEQRKMAKCSPPTLTCGCVGSCSCGGNMAKGMSPCSIGEDVPAKTERFFFEPQGEVTLEDIVNILVAGKSFLNEKEYDQLPAITKFHFTKREVEEDGTQL